MRFRDYSTSITFAELASKLDKSFLHRRKRVVSICSPAPTHRRWSVCDKRKILTEFGHHMIINLDKKNSWLAFLTLCVCRVCMYATFESSVPRLPTVQDDKDDAVWTIIRTAFSISYQLRYQFANLYKCSHELNLLCRKKCDRIELIMRTGRHEYRNGNQTTFRFGNSCTNSCMLGRREFLEAANNPRRRRRVLKIRV